jgi:hypothetical protein
MESLHRAIQHHLARVAINSSEWKRRRREVFVPLTYRPGDLAEVDFFETLVELGGARRKAWLFLMRLMHSGRDFLHRLLRHGIPYLRRQAVRRVVLPEALRGRPALL